MNHVHIFKFHIQWSLENKLGSEYSPKIFKVSRFLFMVNSFEANNTNYALWEYFREAFEVVFLVNYSQVIH